jgi:hypothetical protein
VTVEGAVAAVLRTDGRSGVAAVWPPPGRTPAARRDGSPRAVDGRAAGRSGEEAEAGDGAGHGGGPGSADGPGDGADRKGTGKAIGPSVPGERSARSTATVLVTVSIASTAPATTGRRDRGLAGAGRAAAGTPTGGVTSDAPTR